MKEKKMTAMLLAAILALPAGEAVFASDAAGPAVNPDKTDIKATYVEGTVKTAPVYSVDVQWGSLEYTYDSAKTITWDPQTLKYVETQGTPEWSCGENADKITVTNHSNMEVGVHLDYTKTDANISGTFDQNDFTLKAPAENSEQAAAESKTATLTVGGQLTETEEKKKIGEVTITVTGLEEPAGELKSTQNVEYSTTLYKTAKPGVYKATVECPEYGYYYFQFIIDGTTYYTSDNGLKTNRPASIYMTQGTKEEWILDINKLSITRKTIS